MWRISPRMRLGRVAALPALVLVLLLAGRSARAAHTSVLLHPTLAAQPAAPAGLTLVWVDQRSGQGVDVWASAYDGSEARLVASFPNGARAMAMGGPHLAMAVSDGIALLDLRNGESRTIAVRGQVMSAVIAGDTLFYAVRLACGGPGPSGGQLFRVDIPTRAVTDLGMLRSAGATILDASPSFGFVTLVPRGCDPGFTEILRVNSSDGMPFARMLIDGCGWAVSSESGGVVVVSHQACSGRDGESPVVLYDLGEQTRQPLTPPLGSFTAAPFLVSPDGSRAAFALSVQQGSGPGSTRSGGLWLLDTYTLEMRRLWEDGGAEALAVAWSPVGSYLLAGSVQAQGLCSYAVVGIWDGAVHPVNEEITVCGANGEVLGWTTLG